MCSAPLRSGYNLVLTVSHKSALGIDVVTPAHPRISRYHADDGLILTV